MLGKTIGQIHITYACKYAIRSIPTRSTKERITPMVTVLRERWHYSEKPEGQRLKTALKRGSLNNAISLMSFAGQ